MAHYCKTHHIAYKDANSCSLCDVKFGGPDAPPPSVQVEPMVRVPTADGFYSAEDVREIILERIKEAGSQKAFAEDAGVSLAYVNDYVHFRREPGASLLEAVGMVMVKRYARIAP